MCSLSLLLFCSLFLLVFKRNLCKGVRTPRRQPAYIDNFQCTEPNNIYSLQDLEGQGGGRRIILHCFSNSELSIGHSKWDGHEGDFIISLWYATLDSEGGGM